MRGSADHCGVTSWNIYELSDIGKCCLRFNFLNELTRQHETIKDIGAQVFLITSMRYPALTLPEPASGACDNISDSESEVS